VEGKIDSSEDRRIGRFQKITHKEIAKAFEGGRAQELEVSISSYWVAVGVFFFVPLHRKELILSWVGYRISGRWPTLGTRHFGGCG